MIGGGSSKLTASSGAVYYVDRLSGWFKVYGSDRVSLVGEGKLDRLCPDRGCCTWVWWVRKAGARAWQNPMLATEHQAIAWIVEECDAHLGTGFGRQI